MKKKFVIECELPDPFPETVFKEYVVEAVETWAQSFHPDHRLFGWFPDHPVKVTRSRNLDNKAVSCCQCGSKVVINRKKYHCQSCFDALTKGAKS